MERVTVDVEGSYVLVGYPDALGIAPRVQFAPHRQARLGGGGADQVDDGAVADQRLGPPVLADVGEQAVFDLVPLAGARRQVVDGDLKAKLVGQALQLALPQPHPRAVAATAVGGDDQPCGAGVARPAHVLPPAAYGLHRERRRVVVHSHADPACVGGQVIDTIGHRAP